MKTRASNSDPPIANTQAAIDQTPYAAICAGKMNIPAAIMLPTTNAVAVQKPNGFSSSRVMAFPPAR
jgi:hypothetical protein